MPSRTVTLDSNGSALVPFVTVRLTTIIVTNPFASPFNVNLGQGTQIVKVGSFRQWYASDLYNFAGYLQITSGLANGTLEIYYDFAPAPNILQRILRR